MQQAQSRRFQIPMVRFLSVAALVAGCSASSLAAHNQVRSQGTPVQKVLQLMESMLAKGKQEKRDEQVQFAAYKQFCMDTSTDKKRAVAEADERTDVLKADIEKYKATIDKLTKEVADHDSDIATWKGDQKAATNVRKLEKTDYDAMHKDYSESVDAIQRAIITLKKQSHDRAQTSLVQVSALKHMAMIPDNVKNTIDAFLQSDFSGDLAESQQPEAAGYEFQSGGVVDMLEKLLDKFVKEKGDLEKKEMNSKHAYDMLSQDLTAQISQGDTDREEKSQNKAKTLKAKADASGDLEDTTSTRKADKSYLDDLTATCEKKSDNFESRQELRSGEIEAISKAIEIISSKSVKGSADTHLPSLEQQGSALAMLRTATSSKTQNSVAEFLRRQAEHLDSKVLSELAGRVMADPMAKVKKMIKDLIVRLLEQANEEAEHKGFCDTELSTNEQTRKEKSDGVETLAAEIDQLKASIAKNTDDITELSKAVASLNSAMTKATEIRENEKAKNKQTIADAEGAQTAVAQALTVLKEFYEKAGDATALVQTKVRTKQQPESPEVFDDSYKGMQSESGGVLGMLEVIQSDFARLESDTKASEETSQKEYDTFMTDSKTDKEAKTKDSEHKEGRKQDQSQALTIKKEDLEATQGELDAALAYYDKLKPDCVDANESYEDRVTRRKQEIESLQEALRIMSSA